MKLTFRPNLFDLGLYRNITFDNGQISGNIIKHDLENHLFNIEQRLEVGGIQAEPNLSASDVIKRFKEITGEDISETPEFKLLIA